jgi:hypothetical protein
MYSPVKQAETSSKSREVRLGLVVVAGCRVVVRVAVDLGIAILVVKVVDNVVQ